MRLNKVQVRWACCTFCARPIAGACVAFSAHSDVEGPAGDKHPNNCDSLVGSSGNCKESAGKMRPTTS